MDAYPSSDPRMSAYYAMGLEQDRLIHNPLEEARTLDILSRFLPPPPATILDVGGGAGVYAIPLALRGYAVHLVDLLELHVEQAKDAAKAAGAALKSATVGDAREVEFPDTFADTVLLCGPLYHLTERNDRLAALREAARVTKPGGLVFGAAISRFASAYQGIKRGLINDERFEKMVERDLREGQHRNDTDNPTWFTTAYFHHPDGLAAEVAEAGLNLQALLAIEGPGAVLLSEEEWFSDPARRERLMSVIRQLEAEPSLLGATDHLMAVARTAS